MSVKIILLALETLLLFLFLVPLPVLYQKYCDMAQLNSGLSL